MSAAGYADSGDSPIRQAAMRLAHAEPALLAIVLTLFVTARAFGEQTLMDVPIAAAAATLLLTATIVRRKHRTALCVRCATLTPLDGAAAAATYARWLRLFHVSVDRPTAFYLVAAELALFTLYALLPAPWDLMPFAVLVTWWAACAYAGLRHRVLEPWCPQCDWRRDDDEDDTPAPLPVPTGEATR